MKLFRNAMDLDHWYVPGRGRRWLRFPAKMNGWLERRPVPRKDAMELHEVPLWLAFNTGLLRTAGLPTDAQMRFIRHQPAQKHAA